MRIDDEDEDDISLSAYAETEAAPAASVETAVAVQEEPAKLCCICGLDISQKPRSRDRSGRLWCAPCADFKTGADKPSGLTPCPSCGKYVRSMLMVDQAGEKVCKDCDHISLEEAKLRLVHRAKVTANPETEIRQRIREMARIILVLAAASGLLTLYHSGLLLMHPKPWVPFVFALYFFGATSAGLAIAIGFQYIRIAIRKRERLAEYDRMVRTATNHVLALEDDSHTLGISESPEPLRRRIERAVHRVEACGGVGNPAATKLIETLSGHSDARELIAFLMAQRPGTHDIVARNREIAIISYLQVELATTAAAVTAILLRIPHDQDAMTRQALICFRNGELEISKKIFKRVIHLARDKNSELDLAAAYCNLGMLHVMLSEFDDAAVRYSQAMIIYKKLSREDGEADCLLNLACIGYRQKKFTEVEPQFRKAMAINKRRKRREGLATCCSLLGVILTEKEVPQLSEAKKLLNTAINLNLELGRPGAVAAAYGNLGLVYVKRQDFARATELLLKAQNTYQRINRPKMTAKIQAMLKTVSNLSAAKAALARR
jgi:tetratricopeptide (TPR) repeat protein